LDLNEINDKSKDLVVEVESGQTTTKESTTQEITTIPTQTVANTIEQSKQIDDKELEQRIDNLKSQINDDTAEKEKLQRAQIGQINISGIPKEEIPGRITSLDNEIQLDSKNLKIYQTESDSRSKKKHDEDSKNLPKNGDKNIKQLP